MVSRSRLHTASVAVLLAALIAQVVAALPLLTATSDETSHLPAGYTYLATGDLRLNPQHPPFVKMLCALPLVPLGPALDLDDPNWLRDPPEEWKFGESFLYGNDADRMLLLGRLPVALLSLLLGVFVYRWAFDLFGPEAGLLALFLCAFSPNVIAHSRFVTMDLALACFSFIFVYWFWRWSREDGTFVHAVWAGLFLGFALASKFSAVILLPVLATLAVVVLWRREHSSTRLAAASGIVLALAVVVVWTIYLFPKDPSFYLDGMRQVNADHDPNRAYYLLGQFRVGGFWYYFLAAFFLKTPIPTLVSVTLAFISWKRLRARRWTDEAFLLVPVAAYVAVTSAFADNLGLRYLLPVYPFLFVFASRVWRLFSENRAWRVAGVALAMWYAASSVWIFPDHLAYFNEAAGGPGRGYRHLDDSNLDWGQDLKRLKAYLDERGIERVRLLYPWNADPGYYGIVHEPVTPADWYGKPSPGTYAVATVWLVRGLHEAETRGVPTDWLRRYTPVDRVGYSFFIYRFDE